MRVIARLSTRCDQNRVRFIPFCQPNAWKVKMIMVVAGS